MQYKTYVTWSVFIQLICAPHVIAAGGIAKAKVLARPLIDNWIAEACADIVIFPVVRFSHACNSSNQSLNGTDPAGSQVCGKLKSMLLLFCTILVEVWTVGCNKVQLRYQVGSSTVVPLLFSHW